MKNFSAKKVTALILFFTVGLMYLARGQVNFTLQGVDQCEQYNGVVVVKILSPTPSGSTIQWVGRKLATPKIFGSTALSLDMVSPFGNALLQNNLYTLPGTYSIGNHTISGLEAGSYTITVSKGASSMTKTINIYQPYEDFPFDLIEPHSFTNLNCSFASLHGSGDVNISGGLPLIPTALDYVPYDVWVRYSQNSTLQPVYTYNHSFIANPSFNPAIHAWLDTLGGGYIVHFPALVDGSYYSVYAEDRSGDAFVTQCSKELNFMADIEPQNLNPSISLTSAGCGLMNGSATVSFLTDSIPGGGINYPPVPFDNRPNNYVITWTQIGGGYSLTQTIPNPAGSPILETVTNPSLGAGSYSVNIQYGTGCSKVLYFTITEPPHPQINYGGTIVNNVNCQGEFTGSIFLSVQNGLPPYQYSWSNGVTVANLNNLGAGSYLVTITDGNNCAVEGAFSVSEPASPLGASFSRVNVNCFDGSNGYVLVTGTGGTSPYSVTFGPVGGPFNTQMSPASFTGLGAGNYQVTVTDAHNCFKTYQGPDQPLLTISQPTEVSFSGIQTNVACFGGSNGSIDLSVSGGNGPYLFQWTFGGQTFGSTEDLLNLSSGYYAVTIMDQNGCSKSAGYTITQPELLVVNPTLVQNILCNGEGNGALSVSGVGGTAPYQFLWNTGSLNPSLDNLSPGLYSVTLTDINGCHATWSHSITQPVSPLGSTFSRTNVTCFGGNNGFIQVSANGGTPSYTVTFGPVGGPFNNYLLNAIPYSLSFDDLVAGNYAVTITDNNGCYKTYQGPDQPLLTITQPTGLSISHSQVNVDCFGNSTGSIDLTVSGGTTPYSYSWIKDGLPFGITQDLSNIPAGNYSVGVTYNLGCTQNYEVTITQPSSALTITPVSISNVLCTSELTGSLEILVSGGTAPYSILWNTGAATNSITNLAAGFYSVTVTDSHGCVALWSYTISQPEFPLSASFSRTNVTCYNGNDGFIQVVPHGGTAPYIITFGPVGGIYSSTLTNVAVSYNDLVAGNYAVTITDYHGCSKSYIGPDQPLLVISQPTQVVLTGSLVNVACFGNSTGSINLNVSGGVSPYSYNWTRWGSYFSDTEDLFSIPEGQYCVSVTDHNNCLISNCYTISQPYAPLTITPVEISHILCNGDLSGALSISINGGTGPYTVVWSTGANTLGINGLSAGPYSVTVSDSQGCVTAWAQTLTQPSLPLGSTFSRTNVTCFNGNDGFIQVSVNGGTPSYSVTFGPVGGPYSTTGTTNFVNYNGLGAGNYAVTITDSHGCSKSYIGPDQPLLVIGQPTDIIVNGTIVDVSCFGNTTGSINLNVSGGVAPYSYNWTRNGSFFGDSEDLNGISYGVYCVSVTDHNNCLKTLCYTLHQPADPLTITPTNTTNILCNGDLTGSLGISVSGGTAPYSIVWSTGANSSVISGLAAGAYSVTVTDSHGCFSTWAYTLSQPSLPLGSTFSRTNVSCYNGNDGFIQVSVNGGTPSYSVTFGPVGGPFTTTPTGDAISYNDLFSGNYAVTITDSHGCSKSYIGPDQPLLVISQPSEVIVSNSVINVACFGNSTGSINLGVAGGVGPYSFSWTRNGSYFGDSEDLLSIPYGVYCVTVTDQHNCAKSQCLTVSQPTNPLTIAPGVVSNILCNGDFTGTLGILISGGTDPYTIAWSTGANAATISGLAAGLYSVTVTDSQGCVSNWAYTLTQPGSPLGAAFSRTNVNCFDGSDGFIQVSPTGGTTPYVVRFGPVGGPYSDSPTSGSVNYNGLPAGNYAVTITDANGCSKSYIGPDQPLLVISQPTDIVVSTDVVNVACFGNSTGSINVNVSGGVAPYSFNWTRNGSYFGDSEDLLSIPYGVYCVTITDQHSCSKILCLTVNQPPDPLTITPAGITHILCNGDFSGALGISISGGTAPYSIVWNTGSSSASISGLAAGSYGVTVTDSHGCISSWAYTLTQPGSPLGAAFSRTNVNCNNGNDGFIQVSPTGGTSPYIVTFGPVGGPYSDTPTNGPVNYNGLTAGNYAVTITDSHGCSKSYVGPDQPLLVISQPSAVVVTNTVVHVSCFGNSTGSINLNVSGGVSSYYYNWTRNGSFFSSNEDLENIGSGEYCVTITDQHNCPVIQCFTINQPSYPLTIAPLTPNNILCKGDLTGSLSIDIFGGTAPYLILWNNGSNSNSISGLAAGPYSVTVTDTNGCSSTWAYTLTEPDLPLGSSFSRLNIDCFGDASGYIQVSGNGGTPPYSVNFTLIGGTVQTVALNGPSYSHSFSGLAAGFYAVTITDAHGCYKTYTAPDQPLLIISEPPALVPALIKNDLLCVNGNEGSISLSISGGTAPYHYDVLKDGNPFGSNVNVLYSSPEDVLNLLTAGTYTFIVTDSRGCQKVVTTTILPPSNPLDAQVVVGANVSCFGGSNGWFNVNGIHGQAPYRYSISSAYGITSYQTVVGGVTTTLPADTWSGQLAAGVVLKVENLPAGYYLASIADAFNCVVMYEVLVSQPAQLVITGSSVQSVLCNGAATGSIDISVAGGTPTDTLYFPTSYVYNYLWSNGATTQDLNSLTAGVYSVTVTDAHGCTVFGNYEVTQPVALTVSSVNTDITCSNSVAIIDVSVNGGVAPYTYHWTTGAITQDISSSVAGIFCVTVTDANGCTKLHYDTIANYNQPISLVATGVNSGCYGQNDGSISLSATGGTGILNFLWSNGGTNSTISGLSSGAYSVTVTSGGCVATATYNLTEPLPITMEVIQTIADCETNNVTIIPHGGTEPYLSIVWSGYQLVGCCDTLPVSGGTFIAQCSTCNLNQVVLNNLHRGVYFVTITDVKGCTLESSFTVNGPACPVNVSFEEVDDVNLNGSLVDYGSINIFVCCGTPPYSFQWEKNGILYSTSEDLEDLMPGTYYLTITDARGCTYSDSWEILSTVPVEWVVVPSNEEHIIVIPPSAVVGLSVGDYIGAFYYNGTDYVCGGFGLWNGSLISIAAYGDDSFTPAKDGFVPGEAFVWRVYRPSTASEYPATNVIYNAAYPNLGTYSLNGISGLTTLDITVYAHQMINLVQGWNIISTYINPVSPNFANVVNPLVSSGKLYIAKNGAGNVFWPAYSLNLIGTIDLRDAYMMKMTDAAILDVAGLIADPTTLSISFVANAWRHLGYPRTSAAPVTGVLASILPQVEMVKNNLGQVYWHSGAITVNTLGNLVPGQGYKIKTSAAAVFTYPANSINLGSTEKSQVILPNRYRFEQVTGSNMVVGIPVGAWKNVPAYGDEVVVFGPNGQLCGSAVFAGSDLAITVWGDDSYSPEMEGPGEMEGLQFMVYHVNDLSLENLDITWTRGDGRYSEDKISIAGQVSGGNASIGFIVDPVYPSPASTDANLSFRLGEDAHVVIGVYNSLGHLVLDVSSGAFAAGEYVMPLHVSELSNGLYFVRVMAGPNSQTVSLSVRR